MFMEITLKNECSLVHTIFFFIIFTCNLLYFWRWNVIFEIAAYYNLKTLNAKCTQH